MGAGPPVLAPPDEHLEAPRVLEVHVVKFLHPCRKHGNYAGDLPGVRQALPKDCIQTSAPVPPRRHGTLDLLRMLDDARKDELLQESDPADIILELYFWLNF